VQELVADEAASVPGSGLAVAVVVGGRPVLHVWYGVRDRAGRRPWSADTLTCLFSAGKPLAAFAVLQLVAEGRVELEAPVARYWPGFAAHGKDRITVREALAHLAGIPALLAAPPAGIHDREALTRAVEAQPPLWPPGTQGCFHSFTYGVIAGEIVRRVTGQTFGEYVRARVAPLFDHGFAFALIAAEQARCADVTLPPDNPLLALMTDPATPLGQGWRPMDWRTLNSAAFRGADFPSLAGHGSALGLALFHGMLANGGDIRGQRALPPELAQAMITEQWHQPDPFMGAPVRMGLGVMLGNDVFPFSGTPAAFAQPGLGGVAGLGDASLRLGIGVTPGLLAAGLVNPFLDRLVAATRACL
jgi:CubicO group peptidase (beta-lactamase class C family)